MALRRKGLQTQAFSVAPSYREMRPVEPSLYAQTYAHLAAQLARLVAQFSNDLGRRSHLDVEILLDRLRSRDNRPHVRRDEIVNLVLDRLEEVTCVVPIRQELRKLLLTP
jgi:hypothetical protein